MIFVLLVGFGLIFGSFCNAAIWRLHAKRSTHKNHQTHAKTDQNLSIVTGRSMCLHCGHQLAVIDLIPVLSYLWLRGKCRYCRKPIDDTPVAELLVPLLFVVSYIWWPYDLSVNGLTFDRLFFGTWLLCLVGFVILALYDLRWYLLPDRAVYPLIGLAGLTMLVHVIAFDGGWPVLLSAVWGVLCIAGLFYLLYVVSKGNWIGFGDVKLAIALGLLVGGPLNALLLLFIASLAGSLAAIPLLLRGRLVAKTRIPFGPFLLLATAIVMLFGASLSGWYLGLLVV